MIFRKITAWLAVAALAGPALAGSNLPLVTQSGQTRQLPSGTTLATQPSTTGAASLNVPAGTAPTSPTNGDCWTTTGGYFCQINGVTINLTAAQLANPNGTLGLANGGTGATTAANARTNLGLGTAATQNTGTSGANVPLLSTGNTWSTDQTIQGNLFEDATTADRFLRLNTSSGQNRYIRFATGGLPRWDFTGSNSAESGSNAGTNFQINRFNDAGSFLSTPFSIERATGITTIALAKVGNNCQNILAYGGDATGTNDNATAFSAAVSGNASANNICVYFPAGSYKFNSSPAVTLPSGSAIASVTITGDGADVTRLLPGTNIDGLQLNLTAAQHSFHVRNLSILAANASTTSTGIKVVQTNATLPNPAASDINGVTIRGADGYNSTFKFNIGVDLQSASNVNILGTTIVGSSGGAAYASAGTCLKLSGSASQIPVQFNIVGSQFNYCLRGLDYGAYVQGVQINTTNFVGNGTGIYQASGLTGTDQLAVSSSQFNNGTRDIHLQSAIDGVTITGNDFYLASAGTAAIEMGGYQYSITGNTFIQFAGTPGNGVVINAYSLMAGSITGNSFSGFTTGVVLAASSSNVLVDSNIYHNTTTAVSNAGTGATTLVYDAATVSVSGTTGLGTGGSVGLETGSNSRAGSIRLTAGTSGTAATGSTTLTLGMVAPARWICNLTPNDTVNAWVKPTTLTAAFASSTQVTVNWTNASTALTANGNYYIYYQCLPR